MTKSIKICLVCATILLLLLKALTLITPYIFDQPGVWLLFSVVALIGVVFIVLSLEEAEPRKKMSYEEWVTSPRRDKNLEDETYSDKKRLSI